MARRMTKGTLKANSPGKQFARKCHGAVVASVLLLVAGSVHAADPALPVTGNLLGSVVDDTGTPQIGATIFLLNKYDRVIAKTLSGPRGRFAFVSVPGDVYSIRASVPSFLPAIKNKILVQGGMDSVLRIHLATLLSSIELSYSVPSVTMTDDWKWVLRSSPATRPINRYANARLGRGPDEQPALFSGTHAVLFLSGGDGGLVDSDTSLADMGTGFALSTDIYGSNHLRVSGAFGESTMSGIPQMAMLATYSRKEGGALARPPEVTLTMTQIGNLGARTNAMSANGPGSGAALVGGLGGMVPLRSMSLSTYNVSDIIDGVHLEYGLTGESVDYLQHTSRISPFGRVTIDGGKVGEFVAAYSDGDRPDVLSRHDRQAQEADNGELSSVMNGVGRVPQISLRNGRLRLERTQNAELGWKRTLHSVTLGASAFYEDTIDGRINIAGDTSGLDGRNLLSDSLSTTSFLNIGNYRRNGYLVSSRRQFGDNLDVSLAFGRMGGFSADGISESAGTPHNLLLNQSPKNVAAVNIKSSIPLFATQINAGYGWAQSGSVIPRHIFTTQNTRLSPGLNIYFRQPLPSVFGLPGRLELTGNLQNLLAQGYLPVGGADGRRLLAVQSPRAVRGGLNFIF